MKAMVLVLIAVAVLAYGGGTFVTPQPVTDSRSRPQVVEISRDAPADGDLDAYGNEIADAVSEYSLDAAGGLYERHMPQVELPRLGSAKS